jgi:hypothetical protein
MLHNSVQLVPLNPIFISILFHHYKELMELKAQVEQKQEARLREEGEEYALIQLIIVVYWTTILLLIITELMKSIALGDISLSGGVGGVPPYQWIIQS